MSVAALLIYKLLRLPIVVLAQRNGPLLGCFYQTLPGTILEPGVCGETDILLLYRGINIDPLELGTLDRLECKKIERCLEFFGVKMSMQFLRQGNFDYCFFGSN